MKKLFTAIQKNDTDTVRALLDKSPELRTDISRIFKLLVNSGADMDYVAPNAFGKTYKEQYENETVGEFFG